MGPPIGYGTMAMTTSLLLLALALASVSADRPSERAPARGGSSATGYATVRILSSVSVGHGRPRTASGAQYRTTKIEHPGGSARPAQLIEFE